VTWAPSGQLDGTLSFQSGTMKRQLSVSASAVVTFPNECHGCQCTNLQAQLVSAGLAGANCSPVCNGGACTCSVSQKATYDFTDTYSIDGGSVVTAGGRAFTFCEADAGLALVEAPHAGAMPGTARLAPGSPVTPPEICDGKDNDGNGKVDDDPIDCPPCSTQGVCGEGFTAVCQGAAGWKCTYTSPAWEAKETICDHKDNDCNGQVDEMGGCAEICDGKDNDGDGIIDNNLTDAPQCPTTQGVCASGAAPKCAGALGWQCNYTSPAYEPFETKCDGVDNDCNGATDEGCGCPTGTSKIFYSTGWTIAKADLDGKNADTVLDTTGMDGGGGIGPLKVDRVRNAVYFWNSETLERIGVDGSGRKSLYTTSNPYANFALALDAGRGQLYFVGDCPGRGVCKLDVTAAGAPTAVPIGAASSSVSGGVAVDPFFGKIYWSSLLGPASPPEISVGRANLDGSGAETFFLDHAGYDSMSLATDYAHRALYWAVNAQTTGVFQRRVDGPEGALLFIDSYPRNLATDPKDGFLYYTNMTALRRSNLDGTGAQDLIAAQTWGVDVYVCP
jgi:hypothetical protein